MFWSGQVAASPYGLVVSERGVLWGMNCAENVVTVYFVDKNVVNYLELKSI